MKRFVKLLPSFVLLVISAVLLSTSTFAWFSLNNKVTVTGMEVTTKVSSNLFIASSTANNDKSADTAFSGAINQKSKGTVQPTSSIDGVNFYYTYSADADGKLIENFDYKPVVDNEITEITPNCVAYVDQVFELKAMNTDTTNPMYINLTKLNLLYNGLAPIETGYRVAIFVQEQDNTKILAPATALATTAVTGGYQDMPTTATAIFGFDTDGATYFAGEAKAVKETVAAVGETPAEYGLAAVTNYAEALSLVVAANTTKYFKVTVRLWLEGEDSTCKTSTFVNLTKSWDLNMEFEFQADQAKAVTFINKATAKVNATNVFGVNVFTAALTLDDDTVANYDWYKVGQNDKVASGKDANTYTLANAEANGQYYCVITTAKGNVYKTAAVAGTYTE